MLLFIFSKTKFPSEHESVIIMKLILFKYNVIPFIIRSLWPVFSRCHSIFPTTNFPRGRTDEFAEQTIKHNYCWLYVDHDFDGKVTFIIASCDIWHLCHQTNKINIWLVASTLIVTMNHCHRYYCKTLKIMVAYHQNKNRKNLSRQSMFTFSLILFYIQYF